MTKGELMDLVLDEGILRNTDPALPQYVYDDLTGNYGIDPRFYYVTVHDGIAMHFVNLGEKYYEKFNKSHRKMHWMLQDFKRTVDAFEKEVYFYRNDKERASANVRAADNCNMIIEKTRKQIDELEKIFNPEHSKNV